MSITKLNERTLYALGFDKVTVEALRNVMRVTGQSTETPTVPDIAQQADTNTVSIDDLSSQISAIRNTIGLAETSPAVIPQDMALINALGLLPVVQAVQQVEFLLTEVRQIAEAVAVCVKEIEALKQGTML